MSGMKNLQPHSSIYHNPYPDDDIDLFELMEKLFDQKWLIIGITSLSLLISVIVAFKLPLSFSAKAVLNEPSSANIAAWNSSASQIALQNDAKDSDKYLSTEEAYTIYLKYLTSPTASRYAFERSNLARPASEDKSSLTEQELSANYQTFTANLAISRDNNTSRTEIQYSSEKPEESALIINQALLPYAREQFIENMNENFRAQVRIKKKQLLAQIKRLESNFISYNRLRLTELEEAFAQAQAAGITELRTSDVNATILDSATYLLGEKLLKSRIDAVKKRAEKYRFYSRQQTQSNTDKPYIRGVASRVYEINQLDNLDPDFSSMMPASIEQPALVPVFPSKPNKKLIVTLGGILGLIAGIFLALIRIALANRKERQKVADQNYSVMAGHKIREYSDSDLHPEPTHPDAR
ncbi:Wzz/FepE/Etk N-terminal domain-containing protein [Endozoicomonas arenosclerae]|uniref:Wzz/FepE/Etk N-terminal domain-containing protein n=1 Tax=Endozoicomonas arenosclerae TaxID=1633495 RepID=UPI000781B098|nr:Wzz/FepE/Etk N-terminal domain-containing protein [Endozoicomonas arenosclerae]